MYWLCVFDKHTGKSSFLKQLWWQETADLFPLRASYLGVSAGRLQPVPLPRPATPPAFTDRWSSVKRFRFYCWESYARCDCSLHQWCSESSISSSSSGQVMAILVPPECSGDLETAQKHSCREAPPSAFMLPKCFAISNSFPGAMKGIVFNGVLNRMFISIETIPLPLA